jgi:Protein of unknown function (DUF3558)
MARCGAIMLLAVAGCSSEAVSGDPVSQPSLGTVTSVPSVMDPLSVEKIQNDMCSGLTTEQLAPYLGPIRKQEPDKDVAGTPLCGWYPSDGSMADATLYADSTAHGVADLNERKLGDNFFEKIPPVAGYPAVRRSARPDGPQRGDCTTIVAVSDRATIAVFATAVTNSYQYYMSMCTVSDKLAEAAVGNLKAGG